MHLDRTDFDILAILRKNARTPNKTIAERVGVAPSTALERVRRLHEGGVLRGYHAELAAEALGIGLQALVAVRLRSHSRTDFDTFQAHLDALPEVTAYYHLGGAEDFLVHVGVRNAEHLREFALAALTERPEVAHIQTHLIFRFQRKTDLPVYVEPEE